MSEQTDLRVILDGIEARANKATSGDWNTVTGQGDYFGDTLIELGDTYENWREDVDFIAASRTDVPALVKALRRAIAEIKSDLRSMKANDEFDAELLAILQASSEPKEKEN